MSLKKLLLFFLQYNNFLYIVNKKNTKKERLTYQNNDLRNLNARVLLLYFLIIVYYILVHIQKFPQQELFLYHLQL